MSLHDRLESEAEGQAQQAENLSAFGGFKLAHVKRAVAKLLGMIGREGIFDEYTTHDISHINTMCETLSWLVPESCRADLTPADWLLCTRSNYFHDLGMLVTRREFDARLQSGFVDFRNDILYSGPAGRDYRAKIESLPDDRRERFLYQEFVRHTHAARIRTWIIGSPESSMGVTKEVASTVSALLSQLPRKFVRDLATICESHHLTDLDDVKKYPTNQPYGPSKLETANVQYAAILLRTTDLLHITSNRTPSVTYHAISPTDPISQDEWAKQRAVLSVRPKPKRDEDGKVDRSHVSDAIEIRAYFTQPEGFFSALPHILTMRETNYDRVSHGLERRRNATIYPTRFHGGQSTIQTLKPRDFYLDPISSHLIRLESLICSPGTLYTTMLLSFSESWSRIHWTLSVFSGWSKIAPGSPTSHQEVFP